MLITPKFKSVAPNLGAAGGTLVKVNAPGVGTKTKVTLGFANGTSVCNTTIVNSTGEFYCLTNPSVFTAQAMAVVELGTTNTNHACVNTVATECQFTQS
jgi:hypothetical protein